MQGKNGVQRRGYMLGPDSSKTATKHIQKRQDADRTEPPNQGLVESA